MGGSLSSAAVSAAPVQSWPCANCQTMVHSTQSCCPVCHGRQVKIPEEQPREIYLERVCSPSSARETPTESPVKETIIMEEAKAAEISTPMPPPFTTKPVAPKSSNGDDELDASPRHDIIMESDELRPVDPVAVTLASVPSPVPALPFILPASMAPAVTLTMKQAGAFYQVAGMKREASPIDADLEAKKRKVILAE